VMFAMTIPLTETLFNKAIGMLNVLKAAITFLLVKCVVQVFCWAIMQVTEPKTSTEKGGFPPCLQPKLDVTLTLERYSCFWH
jgi:hypothetical protein